ncbi:MAG: ABC transporter permease, partial [Rhodospirillales bacterium]|nr:ABC transporter permease [Rhodospirillales bacterium]
MLDILEVFLTAGFWAATIRIACPLILGTIGELICERAGVLNLGIEGIMTVGAMAGWMWVYQGGDLYTGLLFAAFVGAMFGWLHSLFTVHLGLSQHVSGIGITMLASA